MYVYVEYPKMIRITGVDHIVYNREEEDALLGVKEDALLGVKEDALLGVKKAPKKGKKLIFTMDDTNDINSLNNN
jgi:uncharacterized protein with PIN domain